MRCSRAIPLALGSLLLATVVCAEPETRPAIFIDGPMQSPHPTKLSPPPIVRPKLPISEAMRAALNERVSARTAATITTPALLTAERTSTDSSGDVVVMQKYVVLESHKKEVTPERLPGYLAHAFTTGDIAQLPGNGPMLRWNLGHVYAPSYGSVSTAPRVELALSWRW